MTAERWGIETAWERWKCNFFMSFLLGLRCGHRWNTWQTNSLVLVHYQFLDVFPALMLGPNLAICEVADCHQLNTKIHSIPHTDQYKNNIIGESKHYVIIICNLCISRLKQGTLVIFYLTITSGGHFIPIGQAHIWGRRLWYFSHKIKQPPNERAIRDN